MPLPTLNTLLTNPNPTDPIPLAAAALNHPPVTGGNELHNAKEGNLTWNGNQMVVSPAGVVNYSFIPAVPYKVTFCVVDCNGGGDAYVISDQYGGCEYHELYNANLNMLGFLHIYRGDGAITPYTLAGGWVLRSAKRSAVISQQFGMAGSNWSVSLIDRTANPPTVQSKFIHVQTYPSFTVTGEDNGDTPYPQPGFLENMGKFFRSLYG
jgi:hypothetical protein